MSDLSAHPRAWPFVESPNEFTARLLATFDETGDMLAAVRHVLIESPPKMRTAAHEPVICKTCNGHGLIGGWRPGDGYDAEPCPDCTPLPAPPVSP